ncbi:MAG: type 2 isopentenyl-diphosphate Delta-isomerase [Kiritimatiellia bacterium]
MTQGIHARKQEHVDIARHSKDADRRKYYFDSIRLMHRALPDMDLADIDTSTTLTGKTLTFPLLISSMTGGAGNALAAINRNLAIAANEVGVALAIGSMRILIEDPATRHAFCLREFAPDIPLCGNIGAVQLNYGITPAAIARLAEQTQIDALCLHFNPLQEATQPEGQTNFAGLIPKIRELVATLPIPVIAKEVGAGVSPADARMLIDAGVQYIEVAGSGGTSWSRIEYERDPDPDNPGQCFQDWGIPTPDALRLLHPFRDRITLIASGGVRTGIDMAKALILGASLCGVARPFLDPACISAAAVVTHIRALHRQFRTAMLLLGTPDLHALIDNRNLLLDYANPS